DEGPHASAAFMANLSSIGGTNGSSSSHINDVQISDDLFFSDVSYLLAQEMQQEEHLNSEFDWVFDDNMITYDEYQNDFGVETVPTVVSADEADKQSMIAILQRLHTEIAGYVRVNDEHKLVNATLTAELERCKIEMQAFERNKVYWLPAAKIASQSSTPAKPVAPFVHTQPVKSDVHKKKNLEPLAIGEHFKVLELEAKILKKQQVINDAEKRCAFIQNEHVKLQLKFQKYKECDTSNSTTSNAIFEINKLKEQLQGRDDSIRNLQSQNDIMSLLNVGSTDDSCNKQALETELTQLKDTVTSFKIQNDGYKVTNANLNRRTNKETLIPLPKKKQVTFQETLKPSPRFTKKPVAPLHKKPNINVPLSTGIKSATGAGKPASKSNAWIYRKLPAKSAKGEKGWKAGSKGIPAMFE
nr:hypothetical protein [Tanacetum cinerariifolium]